MLLTKNYPSWITTNLVNLKTLQVLGENIINSNSDFIILDSFQFHNESIFPTKLASNWIKNLAQYSNFKYIPLYKKLNESENQGNLPTWQFDSHLNKMGNKLFADSMFSYLKTKLH